MDPKAEGWDPSHSLLELGTVSKGFGQKIFSHFTPKNEEESDPFPPLSEVKWAQFRDGITADIPFETAPIPWA